MEERIIVPGARHFYDDHEPIFVEERALAQLLLDDKMHLNTAVFGPGESWEEKTVCAFLTCNDLFSWGCADGEPVTYGELESLYDAHMADPIWGTDKWVIYKRKQMPQGPVVDAWKKAGVWDIDESRIGPNTQQAETTAIFAQAAAQMMARGEL